mmetsp:Transcript_29754/g.68514  ORF Transcript_29754/g.68514 Transcript_29754/m.68514 type:complete len:470 (-) Transcript_29754:29-1438(-)
MASPALTEPPPLYSLRRHDLRCFHTTPAASSVPAGTAARNNVVALQCPLPWTAGAAAAASAVGTSTQRRLRSGSNAFTGVTALRRQLHRLASLRAGSESGEAESAEDEVLRVLKTVTDEGLGTDIVSAGFVGDVRASRERGMVTLKLEVSIFNDQVRETLKQIPWVSSVEVRAAEDEESEPVPPEQSQQPQRLPPPPSMAKVKSVIAVSSCKGGVGKSAVAVNLAFELSKKGAKVGIFDCDIYGPSLPVMVKLPVEPELEMYLDEQEQRHIVPLVHPESGIKLVSFGYIGDIAVMRGSIITSLIVQLLTQTDWGELDYLILDLPPGTGDIHLTLVQTCEITAAVIVTTPQKLSIIDVERGISMFRKLDVPSVAVVQNMSYFSGPDCEKIYPFGETSAGDEIAEAFGIKHVFEIPIDPDVSAGGDSGVPFVVGSDGKPAEVISDLADVVRMEVDAILAKQAPKVLSPEFT